jgi:hypothetical protein
MLRPPPVCSKSTGVSKESDEAFEAKSGRGKNASIEEIGMGLLQRMRI